MSTALASQTTTAEIITGLFPLSVEPIDIQLTVHINNYLLTYRHSGAINNFKELLHNPDLINDDRDNLVAKQIVSFYGLENCRQWFTMVYGWKYE